MTENELNVEKVGPIAAFASLILLLLIFVSG